MAEYGIPCPEQITWGWTPGQVLVALENIRRRHALETADRIEAMYMAMAAAQGGKKGYKPLRQFIRRLRRDGGWQPSGASVEDIASAMGLSLPTGSLPNGDEA